MSLEWDKSPDDWFNHDDNLDAISEDSFNQFLRWEKATRDTIDFKKIYVDMAGDLNAGLALSEIVYWYLPNKENKTRLRVKREGRRWIACQRHNWWDRTRMSPKQIDRALGILVERGLIEKKRFRFKGEVTVHVSLIHGVFQRRWNELLASPLENPFLPKGKTGITEKAKPELPKGEIPLTESTTESTTESLSPVGGWQIKDILQFVEAHGKTTYSTLVATFGREAQLEIQKLVRDGKLRDDFDGYTIPVEGDEQPAPIEDWLASQVEAPDEYDKLLARVEHHYEVAGTYSKDITALLRGTSKTGDWKANNLETPITADEFDVWVGYYRSKHPEMTLPTKPTLVNGYVTGWQRLGKPAAPQSANRPRHANKPEPTAAPALSDSDRTALAAEVRAMREGLNSDG